MYMDAFAKQRLQVLQRLFLPNVLVFIVTVSLLNSLNATPPPPSISFANEFSSTVFTPLLYLLSNSIPANYFYWQEHLVNQPILSKYCKNIHKKQNSHS